MQSGMFTSVREESVSEVFSRLFIHGELASQEWSLRRVKL